MTFRGLGQGKVRRGGAGPSQQGAQQKGDVRDRGHGEQQPEPPDPSLPTPGGVYEDGPRGRVATGRDRALPLLPGRVEVGGLVHGRAPYKRPRSVGERHHIPLKTGM